MLLIELAASTLPTTNPRSRWFWFPRRGRTHGGCVAVSSFALLIALGVLVPLPLPTATAQNQAAQNAPAFRAALVDARSVTAARLVELAKQDIQAIVLPLRPDARARSEVQAASVEIRRAGLALYYWVEVARCPELADAHPEWMASLQGHDQWRRLFPNAPRPGADEVVKTYPWVPILNQEAFGGQLLRIRQLLADRPPPQGVFLNDLQGAPSACGCGNHLCRWTTDYGKIRTATPLGNSAPAQFLKAIKSSLPDGVTWIPVWTTECERHDGAADGLCAGVGCYQGICWDAFTQQLMPVAAETQLLGALVPYRAFQRDLTIYGGVANWIPQAIESLATMPRRYQQPGVAAERVVAILQGWDVDQQQIEIQRQRVMQAGAHGFVVAYDPIQQDWQPQLYQWKKSAR